MMAIDDEGYSPEYLQACEQDTQRQYELALEEYQEQAEERAEAMGELRAAIKTRKVAYRSIASLSGNTSSWVGVVLRGGYPHGGAFFLPKNIRGAIEAKGFDVPQCLVTF